MTLLHSPWSFTQSTEQNPLCGEIRDSRGHLVFYRAVTSEEDKAAMQCAAASPEMLVALKAIKKARGNCGASPFEQEACRMVDAAIAKAEGCANG